MVLFKKAVIHIINRLKALKNVKTQQKNAKNSKWLTIVLLKMNKILNNKSLTMAQSSQLFQFIEISLFTNQDFIKFTQAIKNLAQAMQ